MLFTSLLTVTLVTPAVIATWGDWCYTKVTDHRGLTFNFNGVCVGTSECYGAYEMDGISVPGACPGDPAHIQCCYAPVCYPIQHGRCPGGDNIKCRADTGYCWETQTGRCPGGDNFRAAPRAYMPDGVPVKCS
ncbi:uncharacterized protein LOC62_01G000067 [Vanrija pseudolonga]|uniref:Uncharacterized protein n=1 Tax=Vanrija pseudolonga TaxID=143232 RepID=A0AAF0XYW4_9TREE|nr:hypothetical protein LOC62_01G000067 [Vanrija pseudolonga]